MFVYPLKIALSLGGFGSPSNTWILWPIRVYIPSDISVGSAVFAQLVVVPNTHRESWPTFGAKSVSMDRIYALRSGDAARKYTALSVSR